MAWSAGIIAKLTVATGTARQNEWCRRFMLNSLLLIFMSTGTVMAGLLPISTIVESVCACETTATSTHNIYMVNLFMVAKVLVFIP